MTTKKPAKQPGRLAAVAPKPKAAASAVAPPTEPDTGRIALTYRVTKARHRKLLETARLDLNITISELIDLALENFFMQKHGTNY